MRCNLTFKYLIVDVNYIVHITVHDLLRTNDNLKLLQHGRACLRIWSMYRRPLGA